MLVLPLHSGDELSNCQTWHWNCTANGGVSGPHDLATVLPAAHSVAKEP
jgi:hypothetical protein